MNSTTALPDFLVDQTQATQLITRPTKSVGDITTNIRLEQCNDQDEKHWNQNNQKTPYEKGVLFGRGDYTNLSLSDFFKKFTKMLEAITKEELVKKDKTFEIFKDDFKALEHVFNMVIRHLKDSDIDLNQLSTLVAIQGYINTYLTSLKNS